MGVTVMINIPEFQKFQKISRLHRDIIVTEKIDGTNATVFIDEDLNVYAGSRTRWITTKDDNHGFAKWVENNSECLKLLGPGWHRGEWWGKGINRGYEISEKRFSLFNVTKWSDPKVRPACCDVVPVLYCGPFYNDAVGATVSLLRNMGSSAAPGYMSPEGVVVFHTASGSLFKVTLENDQFHKGEDKNGS
jgi:hypothetical protein